MLQILERGKILARFRVFEPRLLRGQAREHRLFQLVRTLRVIGIIADKRLKGKFVVRADKPERLLKLTRKAIGAGRVRVQQNEPEKSRAEEIHGVGRPHDASNRARRFTERRRLFILVRRSFGEHNLGHENGERSLHRRGSAVIHGQPILKVIQVRNRAQ